MFLNDFRRIGVLVSFFSCLIQIAYSLTCQAAPGTTCTGATYCSVNWVLTNNQWTASTQECIQTEVHQSNVNQWVKATSTEATYICSTDNCNSALPPTDLEVSAGWASIPCQRELNMPIGFACAACGISVTQTGNNAENSVKICQRSKSYCKFVE